MNVTVICIKGYINMSSTKLLNSFSWGAEKNGLVNLYMLDNT